MVRDVVVVVVVGCLAIGAVASYATFRIWMQGQRDDQRPADAIVVMGAAQYNGRPSPVFAARLDHAVELFHAGVAQRLIVTGGKADGDRTTEAATARAYAIAHGVPADAILGEDASRTTLESIRAVGDVLRKHDLKDAVFVSDRPHMLRVLRMAADEGITAWGSPTRDQPHRARPARPDRRDAPRARSARGVLPGRRSALIVAPSGVSACVRVFPLGEDGLAPYTVPKPVPAGSPRTPELAGRSGPRPPLPRTEREPVKQAEEASFVDLIACERDCRTCSYAAALDCDGNCGVCPHNGYCPCVNPVVARSKTALRLIELRPILLQDLQARN